MRLLYFQVDVAIGRIARIRIRLISELIQNFGKVDQKKKSSELSRARRGRVRTERA